MRWKAQFFLNQKLNTNKTPKEKSGFKTKKNVACNKLDDCEKKLD